MKAKLVVELIKAHSSKNEEIFKTALCNLINDEEKKGNISLSVNLQNAYEEPYKKDISTNVSFSGATFDTQSISANITPKDKDSMLDLIEIIEPTVKLSDVSLPEQTEDAILQIIEEQSQIETLTSRGIMPTNRVLFCGPPGCGKTLTANAIAGELGIPIAYVRLDALVSSYLGQTGANIRKIFEFVKDKRIMLFLDEFDAIAKKRDDSNELGELKRIVTTLLQNMDGMPNNVFLVSATNHHQLLDPAIWRRFNTSVLLSLPNKNQREDIILNFKNKILSEYTFDIQKMVLITTNMSGANIIEFLQSLAKYCVMNKTQLGISIEEILPIWLNHSTDFISDGTDIDISVLVNLKEAGIPLRTISSITGVPTSTISYRLKRETEEEIDE